jgi:hypothetical protein
MPSQGDGDFQMFELTRQDYLKTTENLRNKAIAVEGNHFTLQLEAETRLLLEQVKAWRPAPDFVIEKQFTA